MARSAASAPPFSCGEGHTRATIHKDSPPKQWRAWLENFARERGLDFDLEDPPGRPGVPLGQRVPRGESVSRNKALDAEAWAAAQALVRDPAGLISVITKRQAVFRERDLRRILCAHEIPDIEATAIMARALASPEILHLRDAATGTHEELFTTRSVPCPGDADPRGRESDSQPGDGAPKCSKLLCKQLRKSGRIAPCQASRKKPSGTASEPKASPSSRDWQAPANPSRWP